MPTGRRRAGATAPRREERRQRRHARRTLRTPMHLAHERDEAAAETTSRVKTSAPAPGRPPSTSGPDRRTRTTASTKAQKPDAERVAGEAAMTGSTMDATSRNRRAGGDGERGARTGRGESDHGGMSGSRGSSVIAVAERIHALRADAASSISRARARSFSVSLLSWPQAARMSRPRGVRTGEA